MVVSFRRRLFFFFRIVFLGNDFTRHFCYAFVLLTDGFSIVAGSSVSSRVESNRIEDFEIQHTHYISMTLSIPMKIIVVCFAVAALVAATLNGSSSETRVASLKGSAARNLQLKIVDGKIVNSKPAVPAPDPFITFKSNASGFLAGKTTFAETLDDTTATLFSRPGSGPARSSTTATKLATALSTKPGEGNFIANAKASNALPIVSKDFTFGGSDVKTPDPFVFSGTP